MIHRQTKLRPKVGGGVYNTMILYSQYSQLFRPKPLLQCHGLGGSGLRGPGPGLEQLRTNNNNSRPRPGPGLQQLGRSATRPGATLTARLEQLSPQGLGHATRVAGHRRRRPPGCSSPSLAWAPTAPGASAT